MQLESNYLKAANFIAKAATMGAQLAVLPEYHLTNWLPEDPKFASLCAHWETYLNKYRALANTHNISIVPGTIVEYHKDANTDEEKLVNVAYFISNDGEVLGRYQKKNLWYKCLNPIEFYTCGFHFYPSKRTLLIQTTVHLLPR